MSFKDIFEKHTILFLGPFGIFFAIYESHGFRMMMVWLITSLLLIGSIVFMIYEQF